MYLGPGEPTNPALEYVNGRFNRAVEQTTGKEPWQHVVEFVNGREHTVILSLGAGLCAHELAVAQWFTSSFALECMDLSQELLARGAAEAEARGIALRTICQDANVVELEPERYDLVIANNCLHHFLELEHVLHQISQSLRPEGRLFVLDCTARNGMRLWPEALVVADAVWQLLPERLRRELTAPEGDKPVREHIPDFSVTGEGFECIRSQEVLPLVERFFRLEHLVKGYGFARHFVENNFGPNYDVEGEADRQILDLLCDTDLRLVGTGLLRPEYFFAWAEGSQFPAEDFARAAEEFHARPLTEQGEQPEPILPEYQLVALRQEVGSLRWEVECLRKSTSFRLGNFLVSKLRFLRRRRERQ